MKKTYITPGFLTVALNMQNHLLVDSGTNGLSVDPNQSVSGNFVKEDNTVTDKSIWDEEW